MDTFAVSHPRAHSKLSRVVSWIRGPRPSIELPPPSPLLDINFTARAHRVSIPIETTLVNAARPFRRPWVFALVAIGYIIGIAFLSHAHSFSLSDDAIFLGCTSTLWLANSQCGLNGQQCLPLNTSATYDFRCPPGCGTLLQNPRTIGAEEMDYVPLVVGGGDEEKTYRADSFICSAASQAGIITTAKGDQCARLHLVGEFTNFLAHKANGVESSGFPTTFPLAFRFSKDTGIGKCNDLRDAGLAVGVVATAILFLVLQPKPIVLYWSLICIGFWTISLFTDSGTAVPDLERQFGRFLPLLFISYAFWRGALRYTLPAIVKAPIEGFILYGSGFWVGVLNNKTFDQLPLSRLTASDLNKRPGSLATFIILLLVVFICGVNQARIMRKTGWLLFYVRWYAAAGVVLLVLALLPTLSLRLHHYILPMLLLPATAFPTRLSAIYQGVLIGLFLHGVARWGYDSIVQTAASLRQDAVLGSVLPTFLTNSTTYNSSIPLANQTLAWEPIIPGDPWVGFSLLVDDVERYVGLAVEYSLASLDPTLPHFFRLAYKSDITLGDYTKAAILWPNGTWVDPAPGPSY
ncbi:LCCL domain-containing protein [Coprinopsis cinerea AmutBmut pab1-1]|nr:LCCL domain-containing protein [Coprinopsis cinerea AmutBmut pab1-1]